ncbi:hypothetical protein PF005_g4035 [Phytophthora fragariae]|uniref:SET domain-containing protein n=1 Tax=Phytophthora fragariae TaxID=53985 RepID=A0A6A3T8S6_9STRA|nr:hypothetical protein PF003_g3978 [Phytophthora fragariae]KAE8945866.1 hypothetical protein PF009_g4488 [Phytophthora fragariae]KAE9131154.1 hypothetical protein PF010_g3599 [Phytophthora fragariae]KAE9131387.1 hypothetical protein PF007_g4168 [Phytophthora fragariae]KAE9145490.1 hypothetical protein PF006_g9655 [Phytophthora fragariae]
MAALATITDGLVCCPTQGCGRTNKADEIDRLRRHCSRDHNLRVTLKSARVSTEETRRKQRLYSARYREKRQKIQARQRAYHQEEDDANVVGACGSAPWPVEYRASSIPGAGKGLFAVMDLMPGDIVTWYAGMFTTVEPTDKAYAIAVVDGFIDGLRVPQRGQGLGSFVNRESREISRKRNNCELVGGWNSKHQIYVEVTSKIKAGKELFTAHSRGYQLK